MRIVHKGQILPDAQHVVVIVARQLQRVAMAAPETECHLGGKTNPDPRQHAAGDNPADGGEERTYCAAWRNCSMNSRGVASL